MRKKETETETEKEGEKERIRKKIKIERGETEQQRKFGWENIATNSYKLKSNYFDLLLFSGI